MGNIFSLVKKIKNLGFKVSVSNNISKIEKSDKIILPGVGNHLKAMENINKLKLFDVLNQEVIDNSKPILGICLGMQLMFNKSEEGDSKGFGWIDGTVKKFNIKNKKRYKIPHVGWNKLIQKKRNILMKNIDEKYYYYFVHSYYCECSNKSHIISNTIYESEFCSTVNKKNIYGVQYHPEKSHDFGTQILKNFLCLDRE